MFIFSSVAWSPKKCEREGTYTSRMDESDWPRHVVVIFIPISIHSRQNRDVAGKRASAACFASSVKSLARNTYLLFIIDVAVCVASLLVCFSYLKTVRKRAVLEKRDNEDEEK